MTVLEVRSIGTALEGRRTMRRGASGAGEAAPAICLSSSSSSSSGVRHLPHSRPPVPQPRSETTQLLLEQ
jgi:hypothetical protein